MVSTILAVLISSIVMMVIGSLWYSPMLFAKQWMAENKMSPPKASKKQKQNMMYKGMFIMFLLTIITSYMLVILLRSTSISAIMLAILIWIGFVAAPQAGGYMFEQRSFKLFWINTLHTLAGLIVASAILSALI